MDFFRKYALALHHNGYGIVPLESREKKTLPNIDWPDHGWQQPETDWVLRQIEETPEAGIGIVNGRTTVAFDFDTPSAKHNQRFVDMATEIFGTTPLHRVGQPPKIAMLYRAVEPIISIRIPKIDVLGLRTQLASYGVHPRTKSPYRWVGESTPHEVPVSELPSISNAQIETLMTQIARETLGASFKEFRLELDRNFMPIVLTSRTILLRQLMHRMFLGKTAARKRAHVMMQTKVPSGCWGLTLRPICDEPIYWGGNFPDDPSP